MFKNHLISIVGAGPGDPDLLTVKALRRIQEADVILYDALHGDEVLQLASTQAVKIYAGKHYQDGQHQTERQDKIHEQLKEYALQGLRVVRLKAGDPFIFGRGAEELEFCFREQLTVEVVPGITAGLAAASAFHIPVTLRGENSMALFYTGHKRNGGFSDIDTVASVLKSNGPVIVYMGLKNLQLLVTALLERGVDRHTPLQISSRVGHADQQNYSTSLEELDGFLRKNEPPMPAVILIGTHAKPVLPEK
ncbi:uroporphyrinogen-III C-methyltransferase [Mangrovibacterium marinum]|uniref:uroporphyrinogen-III C-methyltransferase n=1 Tax=Mangrovibacterium marinum TaxID=1639118 RepID=A0A2T5BY32_9BACT|nr:uroporphyrinogen-III C-methyltransferase [Mangrovibacterium marinum]PTN06357.1 uroporphyrinogen-III C-methyltransferase [Mangrovibacterium marinum]